MKDCPRRVEITLLQTLLPSYFVIQKDMCCVLYMASIDVKNGHHACLVQWLMCLLAHLGIRRERMAVRRCTGACFYLTLRFCLTYKCLFTRLIMLFKSPHINGVYALVPYANSPYQSDSIVMCTKETCSVESRIKLSYGLIQCRPYGKFHGRPQIK
jgi:hypothetical protein